MVSKKKVKSKNGVRFDSKHIRLRTGESEKDNGTYVYRWTDKAGKRHAVYAPTLADLREQEEQIIIDRHDGIKTNVKNITVNDLFDLWVQVKRGVKDSTMKNYIYMYEMFVKPTFGKKKLTQVKKSDVRRFYNQLVDERILKISTLDGIHNVLHQVFAIAVDDDMIRNNPTDNMLRELNQRLAGNGLSIELTAPARELLLQEGSDSKYGARPLRRALRKLVEDPLSDLFLAGKFHSGDKIIAEAADKKMDFHTAIEGAQFLLELPVTDEQTAAVSSGKEPQHGQN